MPSQRARAFGRQNDTVRNGTILYANARSTEHCNLHPLESKGRLGWEAIL
jgi:hypothetical protein